MANRIIHINATANSFVGTLGHQSYRQSCNAFTSKTSMYLFDKNKFDGDFSIDQFFAVVLYHAPTS